MPTWEDVLIKSQSLDSILLAANAKKDMTSSEVQYPKEKQINYSEVQLILTQITEEHFLYSL